MAIDSRILFCVPLASLKGATVRVASEQIGPNVGHMAGHLHSRNGAQISHHAARIRANESQLSVWHPLPNQGENIFWQNKSAPSILGK